jgi:hypothetical protein
VLTAVVPGGAVFATGVTELDSAGVPVPTEFTAATLKKYGVPLVSPVMVAVVVDAPETGCGVPTLSPLESYVMIL